MVDTVETPIEVIRVSFLIRFQCKSRIPVIQSRVSFFISGGGGGGGGYGGDRGGGRGGRGSGGRDGDWVCPNSRLDSYFSFGALNLFSLFDLFVNQS